MQLQPSFFFSEPYLVFPSIPKSAQNWKLKQYLYFILENIKSKEYHIKVLLNSFYLNGRNLRCQEPAYAA